MATMAVGQPLPEVSQPKVPELQQGVGMTYAATLKPTISKAIPLPLKPITYLHGELRVVWEEEKISQMIVNEESEYVVIGKFPYGWLDIYYLRKLIPKQFVLKGDVNIGLLSNNIF
ncbi:hypothetical protein FXO38_15513 [Capsicum annuum]|nr:hypothetical protein FXO38_15513 [Capsicum annuum]